MAAKADGREGREDMPQVRAGRNEEARQQPASKDDRKTADQELKTEHPKMYGRQMIKISCPNNRKMVGQERIRRFSPVSSGAFSFPLTEKCRKMMENVSGIQEVGGCLQVRFCTNLMVRQPFSCQMNSRYE